ncbi:MAG TPA: twin-arginine translocase TatA/TatE family subunit [Archangium sp.]|jgi:sec-independent protein translocase protein TatA
MGTQELIIIFLILFLLFGASRLPQLGSSIGSAIRNFKKGFSGEEEKAADDKKLAQGDGANSITSQDKAKQS